MLLKGYLMRDRFSYKEKESFKRLGIFGSNFLLSLNCSFMYFNEPYFFGGKLSQMENH